MTYGWAILIIAIVLVALFELGIFNAQEPRVSAGACEVFHGSDVGECQGVWPQFVAQFDGSSSYVNTGSPAIPTSQGFSITVWAYILAGSTTIPGLVSKTDNNCPNPFDDYVINGYMDFLVGNGCGSIQTITTSTTDASLNTWQFWTFKYSGGSSPTASIYLNGTIVAGPTAVTATVTDSAYSMLIGSRNDFYTHMDGYLANVQIYNTSLSSNEITALYDEGIGGAPIDPNNIVGWWPLNGNAQDYSGNGNDGTASGVAWNSTWTSGYVQP